MKKLLGAILCAALSLSAVGCAAKQDPNVAPDVVKIGFAGTLSGENALVGQYQKDAIKVVENELAANDGCIEIMGKQVKVEIILEDAEAKPDTCANVYRKFIDDYGVGHCGTQRELLCLGGWADCTGGGEVPVVAIRTNEEVTKAGDYIFRSGYVTPFRERLWLRSPRRT
ncbi:MAG: hypothetical protein ACLTNO_11010 [Blautia sp.]